ncbi:MAG TPA: Asp-tRNA(Asn)/Glu-tRNA(Gln) amidotransferase subunit GatC [Thermoanaerobaculia bacterium]|nr:Asp-tRNA(Asn)/Glu-tRNA(Gln) amidotransferase subunit GatC [Thermoanaerobaculia bacterium]
MQIDRDEARRIAKLAHIEMDDAALDRMAAEMTQILGYIDQLREVNVAAPVDDVDVATPLREDVARPSVDRELVARNAPSFADGCFVVPKVIGDA